MKNGIALPYQDFAWYKEAMLLLILKIKTFGPFGRLIIITQVQDIRVQ